MIYVYHYHAEYYDRGATVHVCGLSMTSEKILDNDTYQALRKSIIEDHPKNRIQLEMGGELIVTSLTYLGQKP